MKSKILTLDKLEIGQTGEVVKLLSLGNERRRMLDLGIVYGAKIEAIQKSPSSDPIAYFIRGAVIALRNEGACKVMVKVN